MTGRRAARRALAGLLLVLLTACGGLPVSGDVRNAGSVGGDVTDVERIVVGGGRPPPPPPPPHPQKKKKKEGGGPPPPPPPPPRRCSSSTASCRR